jgi:hypothetical protein
MSTFIKIGLHVARAHAQAMGRREHSLDSRVVARASLCQNLVPRLDADGNPDAIRRYLDLGVARNGKLVGLGGEREEGKKCNRKVSHASSTKRKEKTVVEVGFSP